jgi:hypothetical protein
VGIDWSRAHLTNKEYQNESIEKDQIFPTSIHSPNDHTVSTCYGKNLDLNIHIKLHADFQTPKKKREENVTSQPLHTSPFFLFSRELGSKGLG